MDEVKDRIRGSNWFTKIDLKKVITLSVSKKEKNGKPHSAADMDYLNIQ